MNDNNIRFIYFRVNILKKKITSSIINHVNCIVIDKKRRFILYFEPTVIIRFNYKPIVRMLVNSSPKLLNFAFLTPKKIGYNVYNRLQKYNHFCQTYVLYIYCLILENRDVEPQNFSKLFNNIITLQNINYFLFFINRILEENGTNLNSLKIDYKYSNGLKKIIKKSRNCAVSIDNIDITSGRSIEEEGWIIATQLSKFI
jgi:hypothetical protein